MAVADVTITPTADLARLLADVDDLAAAAQALAGLPNPWAAPAVLQSIRALAAGVQVQRQALRSANVWMTFEPGHPLG